MLHEVRLGVLALRNPRCGTASSRRKYVASLHADGGGMRFLGSARNDGAECLRLEPSPAPANFFASANRERWVRAPYCPAGVNSPKSLFMKISLVT